MELYPRLGKHFDLKTWTNCRMGMMGWAVIILCYAAKQKQEHGAVADSLLVSVALMQIYIAKFFLCDCCLAVCPAPGRCRLHLNAAAVVHLQLPKNGQKAHASCSNAMQTPQMRGQGRQKRKPSPRAYADKAAM